MAAIIGGDTLGPGKRKPSPAPILAMIEQSGGGRATFVGDSIYDVMAAKAAATASIVVGFGFLDRPAEQLGADHVIGHYDELVPLLERSEEHTSELQSLMRISYAVFCLKKKKQKKQHSILTISPVHNQHEH